MIVLLLLPAVVGVSQAAAENDQTLLTGFNYDASNDVTNEELAEGRREEALSNILAEVEVSDRAPPQAAWMDGLVNMINGMDATKPPVVPSDDDAGDKVDDDDMGGTQMKGGLTVAILLCCFCVTCCGYCGVSFTQPSKAKAEREARAEKAAEDLEMQQQMEKEQRDALEEEMKDGSEDTAISHREHVMICGVNTPVPTVEEVMTLHPYQLMDNHTLRHLENLDRLQSNMHRGRIDAVTGDAKKGNSTESTASNCSSCEWNGPAVPTIPGETPSHTKTKARTDTIKMTVETWA